MRTPSPSKKEKRVFLIAIPKLLIRSISKQLRLKHNPPDLETVETLVLWSLSGALSGEIFNDTLIESEGNSKKALRHLKRETKLYFQDLKEMNKNV